MASPYLQVNGFSDKESLIAESDCSAHERLLDRDVRHGKQKIEGMPTEKDDNIPKESSSQVVEKLVRQYSHVFNALTEVYTQEIEKVCKDGPEERIKESAFKAESRNNFSYKQPCCIMAKHLQTYVLTNCLNPLDEPHDPLTSFCVHQPTTKLQSISSHSLPSSTSGSLDTSARHSIVKEQENNSLNLKAKYHSDFSTADFSKFRDLKVKSFLSVVFTSSKTSMWICGQKKSKKLRKMGKDKPVFMCVEPPDYKVICKKTYSDHKIETPTIMLHISDSLYFTGRNENTVYSLNTLSREFKRKFSTDKLEIAAMCNNQNFLYNCNGNKPETISILDESFQPHGIIQSLKFKKDCDFVDMCFLNHKDNTDTVVISTSFPATVSAVSQKGPVWQLGISDFGNKFKPRSVAASSWGIVFIADCGTDFLKPVLFTQHKG